ncbi:hypothetical protein V5O48_006006 [Marasmius crinis-equi]|uniref:Receptor-activated Ca2+-permeable cation channel n=1 Tax=Marasmius crinis-equi TaxID=585013 RepID=A0ABR3FKP5_9AGAR
MSETQPLLLPRDVEDTPVYPTIHMIRTDVIHFIDTPLSYEALTAPDLTYTLIRPLVEKYGALQQDGNRAVVFCFLINRVHFSRDKNLTTASVSRSRAELCEILAARVLREYGNSMMDLALALTTSWSVYNGADEGLMEMARDEREDLEERVGNAIEVAIVGKARRFLNSSACQKVIDSIWSGKCVYQAQSSHSILSDTYKRNPIHFYDPHKAPLLDHYRLKVPFIRSVLEYLKYIIVPGRLMSPLTHSLASFLILFVLFVFAVELSERDTLNVSEVLFMVYAAGFTLEKVAAMQEHGIRVATWIPYAFLRLYGVYHHHRWARSTGIDMLAIIACLMFPRLAFVTLQNNLMVLSLRAMMIQFLALMLIAAFCFCGFLYALWTLSRTDAQYTVGTIAWWMLDLWFGLDASGFDKASQSASSNSSINIPDTLPPAEFHPLMGPVLMVTYACLSNTLLLTVLVSILSNTFAKINEDAAAEAMFRRAVSTIEGVKADSLFSYQPPINLVAVCIMLPLSYILTPRWFHKVNVFMIRLTSFPILLLIASYERQAKLNGTIGFYDTASAIGEKLIDTLPRTLKRLSLFEGLAGTDADIDAIFEIEDELNTSALDTTREDVEMAPKSTNTSQRRGSSSHPKPTSLSTASNGSAPSPSQDRTQGHVHFESPATPPSPPQHIPPRARVNSVLNRGAELAHSFTSPLAQIYQPLIVDDIPASDDSYTSQQPQVSGSPGRGPAPLISYGPASRRRLSSIQGIHRRTTSDMQRVVSPSQGLHRSQSQRKPSPSSVTGVTVFPSVEEAADKSEDDKKVLTESPPPMTSPLPTVGQVLEDMDADSAQMRWNKRLDQMEQRQQRIESLLEKIAEDIAASRK